MAALVPVALVGALGALPAGASTVKPSITSFKDSPTSLKSTGGTVKLSAVVKKGKTCEFTVKPAVKGLPHSVACTTKASDSVKIGANSTSATKSYVFSFTVTSKTKTSVKKTLTLKETPKAPSVSAFAASSPNLTSAGGSVTLSATVSRATSCKFTYVSGPSSPSGLPDTVSCTSGSHKTSKLTIPANSTLSDETYTFALSVTGPGGTTKASPDATVTVAHEPESAPTVSAFAASPPTLTDAGGDTTLSATVGNATSCQFAEVSGPTTITGLSSPVTCASGTVDSPSLSIPPNTTSSTQTYTFSLAVTGPGGTTDASPDATVTEAGTSPGPTASGFGASPSSFLDTGGSTTLSATVDNATSCQFAEVTGPATITGLSSPVTCASGTVDSPSLSIPPNTTSSTQTYTFSLAVTGPGGTTDASPDATVTIAAGPSVSGFAASPSSLGSSGGSTTLSATVGDATSCQFAEASGPATITGLSSPVTCSAGTVDSPSLSIPANTTSSAETYTFSLVVTGSGGTTDASPDATVTVAASAMPTVSGFAASPSSLGSSGGSTTLSATVGDATSCQFAEVSGPSTVTGLSSPVTCSAGTVDSPSLSIPANTTSSAETYVFSLAVTGPGGTTDASPDASVTVAETESSSYPLKWASGSEIEPPESDYGAVSCPTSSFCASISSYPAVVAVYSSGTWGAPETLDPSGFFEGVDCSSATFCLAYGSDESGETEMFVYNGTTWSLDSSLPSDMTASGIAQLSCVEGSDFCMAIDESTAVFTTTTATTWTEQPGTVSSGLSCVSATSCLSMLGATVYSWNGSKWTSGGYLPSTDEITGFSCSSATECVASVYDSSDGEDLAEVYNGTAWSPWSLTEDQTFGDESCATGGDCFVLAEDSTYGIALDVFNGTSWSQQGGPQSVSFDSYGLSCATSTFCGSVSGPDVSIWSASAWTQTVLGWSADIASVSCGSATYCVAVDSGGNATVYNGSSWTSPVAASENGFSSISCLATKCYALDYSGNVYVYSGGTDGSWSLPTKNETGLSGGVIDCTSTTFCVIVSGYDTAVYTGGSSWTISDTDSTDDDLSSVSCTSSSFCVAVDDNGYAFTYSDGSWSSGSQFDSENVDDSAEDVSCLSATACVATGQDGYAETFNGTSWTSPVGLESSGGGYASSIDDVSCDPAGDYCVAVVYEDVWYLEDDAGTLSWVEDANAITGDGVNYVSCTTDLCVADGFANEGSYGTPNSVSGPIDPATRTAAARPQGTGTTASAGMSLRANDTESSSYPLTFTSGEEIEPPESNYSAVSCPTSSFCAAVSSDPAVVDLYSSGSWGAPETLDSSGSFTGVACSKATFCLAYGYGGTGTQIFVFNGSTWSLDGSLPSDMSSGIAELSCVEGSDFCMAIDFSDVVFTTTNATTWTEQPGAYSSGLDCLSSTSCVSVLGTTIYSWNGTKWTSGGYLATNDDVTSFACASATECVATVYDSSDSEDLAEVYNGTAWSPWSLTDDSPYGEVSCAAGGDCFALADDPTYGNALDIFNGTTWSTKAGPPSASYDESGGLSCATSTFCGSVAGTYISNWSGSSWTETTVGWSSQVTGVSCGSATYCVAVDSGGNATVYNGSSWTSPVAVSNNGFSSISCLSTGQCYALDWGGEVWVYSGSTEGSWTLPSENETGLGGGDIDCTSATFCVVVSGAATAVYTGESSWSITYTDSDNYDLSSVACTSSSFCIAVDDSGYAFTYSDGSWSSGTLFDPDNDGYASEDVSCLSATSCVATGGDGYAETFDGSSWSTPVALESSDGYDLAIGALSCDVAGGYCVAAVYEDIWYLEDESGTLTWVEDAGAITSDGVSYLSCTTDLCLADGFANEGSYGTPST